jgi:hypothetical protein
MGCWSNGVLGCWSVGVLEHLSIGWKAGTQVNRLFLHAGVWSVLSVE